MLNKLGLNLTAEAIKYQKNDWFTKNLLANIESIKQNLEDGNALPVDKWCKDIEEDIFKRFGFKVKIIYNKALLAMENFGFLRGVGIKDFSSLFSIVLRHMKEAKKNNTPPSKAIKSIYDNTMALNFYASNNIIQVDEDNACIKMDSMYGDINPELICKLHVNFHSLLLGTYRDGRPKKELAATVEEIAAGMMHELGHAFTFISYAYKSRRSLVMFEDTLQDNIKKGVDDKKAYLLAYKEAFDKSCNIKKYENTDMREVYIDTIKSLTSQSFKNPGAFEAGQQDGFKSAEIAADQFAIRFGLGVPLGTLLNKIEEFKNNEEFKNLLIICGAIVIINCIMIASGFLVFQAIMSLSIIVLGIVGTHVMAALAKVGGAYVGDYDVTDKRIERLYLDLIRNIRNNYKDEETRNHILKEAIALKEIVDCVKVEEKEGLFVTMAKFFSSTVRDRIEISKALDAYEKAMENDLYLAAAYLDS